MSGQFVHPSQRYRLYFDETGIGHLASAKKDENQRYLSLTGLVCRQDVHDTEVTKTLDDLKASIFGEQNRSIVLHRREIIDRAGVFEVLNDDALRKRFDDGFLSIIQNLPVTAFTVSIDKLEHLNKYSKWHFSRIPPLKAALRSEARY